MASVYGNHPMGTKHKREIHQGKAKLRWRPRETDGQEHAVTVRRVKPATVGA